MDHVPFSRCLKNRVALVTGAGVGIGRAAAVSLAQAGAFVGVHYHTSADGAKETLQIIKELGGQAMILRGDLTVEEQANAVVDQLVKETGRLDILFNNAGSPLEMMRFAEMPLEFWRRVFDVNLTSAFLVTKRAVPHLRASGKGAIINNLTLSMQTGGSGGAAAYAASKGALHVLTRTLAKELAPAVRTNAIMPGVIETRHHEIYSTPEKLEDYRKQTPLARNGTAEEVAQAVVFLASDAASFINGAVLDINGGRFLR
jgi:3-oxoacyl-[acyl-carrier protein] reductase